MAIVEWKSRSGIGGQLDGNFVLTSDADSKVYDDFVKSLRNGQVSFLYIISESIMISFKLEKEDLHEPPQQNLALFRQTARYLQVISRSWKGCAPWHRFTGWHCCTFIHKFYDIIFT
jgi:hypothetical protein